jgi:hypothetical protein
LFGGPGNYLTLADSDDWDFGTGAFTIDFWVRYSEVCDADGECQYFFGNRQDDSNRWYLRHVYWTAGAGRIGCYGKRGGTAFVYVEYTWAPVVDTWYHIALARSGATLYLFIDGKKKTWTNTPTPINAGTVFPNLTGTQKIAEYDPTDPGPLLGRLEEFRWSKGICRDTEDFTPPDQEYTLE